MNFCKIFVINLTHRATKLQESDRHRGMSGQLKVTRRPKERLSGQKFTLERRHRPWPGHLARRTGIDAEFQGRMRQLSLRRFQGSNNLSFKDSWRSFVPPTEDSDSTYDYNTDEHCGEGDQQPLHNLYFSQAPHTKLLLSEKHLPFDAIQIDFQGQERAHAWSSRRLWEREGTSTTRSQTFRICTCRV